MTRNEKKEIEKMNNVNGMAYEKNNFSPAFRDGSRTKKAKEISAKKAAQKREDLFAENVSKKINDKRSEKHLIYQGKRNMRQLIKETREGRSLGA